jgi:hypothetical protein
MLTLAGSYCQLLLSKNSLTNQNLFHTMAVGIPRFLLVECVALSGFLR